MKARDAFFRQLVADGLNIVFGNPGSTESAFMDALARNEDIEYVLGLHESSVMAMADGWARTTGKPAIVQVHAAVGLGNAMGVMYQAYRAHTPLVIVAGEADLVHQAFDGFLAADLCEIARPVTKWSARLTHGSEVLRVLRRAIKIANTPPQGPVFLALPQDVLDQETDAAIVPTPMLPPIGPCSDEAARTIAEAISTAEWPLLLIGDGVALAGACKELRDLAELLACPIFGVEFNDLSAGFSDPMFLGLLSHSFGEWNQPVTHEADVILCLGTPLLPELFPARTPYFSPRCRLFQIDSDPWELAKNFPTEISTQADIKASLFKILRHAGGMSSGDGIDRRREAVRLRKLRLRDKQQRLLDSEGEGAGTVSPGEMMRALAPLIPRDAIVYDESMTCTPALLHYLQPSVPGS